MLSRSWMDPFFPSPPKGQRAVVCSVNSRIRVWREGCSKGSQTVAFQTPSIYLIRGRGGGRKQDYQSSCTLSLQGLLTE